MAKSTRQRKEEMGMTVYPDLMVAASLGGFTTNGLTLGVRIADHLLTIAAEEVAPIFSPAEWELLATVLLDRIPTKSDWGLFPNMPDPGPQLAPFVSRTLLLTARAQDKAAQGPPLAERVAGLTYLQAWAMLIAVRFRRDNAEQVPAGVRWWEPAVRWRILFPEVAA